jgi:uracil-DNA glycosylase
METDQNYKWINRLKADPKWNKIRFKRLDKGHYTNPSINLEHDLIDVVNFNVFVRIEENRIPLFIGPSYKVLLTLKSVYLDHPDKRTIAVLDESPLPGEYRGLIIQEYFRGHSKTLAFFRNESIYEQKLDTIDSVVKEATLIRHYLKLNLDSEINRIDMSLSPIPPYWGNGEIRLIIIGQDPTIKNLSQRSKISTTLNLNRSGSLKRYIELICEKMGLTLENVYATNIFKYFYTSPPATTMDVLFNHLTMNIRLLRRELEVYPGLKVITLGEPVLQLLSNIYKDRVRYYWDYGNITNSREFRKCIDNEIDRSFYPFPHQPSLVKRFYSQTLNDYLNFVAQDIAAR